MIRPAAFCISLAVLVSALPRPADACEPAYSDEHQLEDQGLPLDQTPPSAPDQVEAEVRESKSSPWARHSCAGQQLRQLLVRVAGAADDRTPAQKLGFRVELVGGQAPPGAFPTQIFRAMEGLIIVSLPLEGDLDAQIAVRAVDLAGNQSPLGQSIGVQHLPAGGCTQAGGGMALPALLVLMVASVGLRLRRRRASGGAT